MHAIESSYSVLSGEFIFLITTNSQPHLLRSDHPQPTVHLVIGNTPSEPKKRLNREKARNAPWARERERVRRPLLRGWGPSAQAALRIVLSRLSRFFFCWLGLVDNQVHLFDCHFVSRADGMAVIHAPESHGRGGAQTGYQFSRNSSALAWAAGERWAKRMRRSLNSKCSSRFSSSTSSICSRWMASSDR